LIKQTISKVNAIHRMKTVILAIGPTNL